MTNMPAIKDNVVEHDSCSPANSCSPDNTNLSGNANLSSNTHELSNAHASSNACSPSSLEGCSPTSATINAPASTSINLVKWKTPEEELINAARLGHLLAYNNGHKPKKVCLALPNQTWISQCVRACKMLKVDALICLPVKKLSPQAKQVLAILNYLDNHSDEALEELMGCGLSANDCQELFKRCKENKGFSLLRNIGALEVSQLEHAISLLDGDEDIHALNSFFHEQLRHPTISANSAELSITTLDGIHADFDYVFCLACAEGLIKSDSQSRNSTDNPDNASGTNDANDVQDINGASNESGVNDAQDINSADAAHDINTTHKQQKHLIEKAQAHAKCGFFVSYFTRIEKRLADAAHIHYVRCKKEHEKEMAMTAPDAFFEEQRLNRPSTMSGQALLRSYGLN